MSHSAINRKWQTLAGTSIAFVLGFALVMFVLNIDAPKVSASSEDPTTNLALSNTAGSLVIDIAPKIAVNQLGDPHTVVATVSATGSQPVPNVVVNFEVIVGPNSGVTNPVTGATTNSNGEASFTYTSTRTGIDIIQVCVTDQNSGQACDLAVKWWIAATPDREIDLSPASATNPVGTGHTVTATLLEAASPLGGASVNFEILAGPTVGLTGSGITDGSGEAPFTYTGTAVGVDTIQVCASDGNSGRVCDQATKEWTTATPTRTLDLSPPSAANPVGTSHTVIASVVDGTSPVSGVSVAFEILSGPTVGVTGSATTDSNGEAPFTYTGTAVGVDTIQACASDGNSGSVCDQALKEWTTSRTLDLSPDSATNPVGTSHTVIASVVDATIPVSGVLVAFEILSGPTVGVTGAATTDSNGEAPFTYTGTATGSDTIQACASDGSSGRVCDQATKRWTSVSTERTVNLSPELASNPVGTGHSVIATVVDGDQLVSGALVVFEVLSGPTVGVTGSATTTNNGEAPFTYVGIDFGLDTIQACTSDTGQRICDQALKQWTAQTPDRFIELEPARATNPVGTSHTVIASITEGDERFPSHGVLVNFEVVSGPTVGLTGSATTVSNGEAPFTYTGIAIGLDRIQACFQDGAGLTCAQAAKQWKTVNGDLTLELSPKRATNPVGTSHTVTAAFAEGNQPVSGALVAFEVVRGPNDGVTGSATTNNNGEAPFTYTGTETGTDTIRACTSNGDVRICDQATKKWTGDQIPPGDGTSCQGEGSCQGNNVSVGANSCNAEHSCNGNNISIGDNSCNEEDSCRGNSSHIGDSSCNGEESCRGNRLAIGDRSCGDEDACRGNNHRVGDGSCNGEEACKGNHNQIGDDSCNGEEACKGNNLLVGDNQCNRDEACGERGGKKIKQESDEGEDEGEGKDKGKGGDNDEGEEDDEIDGESINSNAGGGGNIDEDEGEGNKGKGNKGGRGRGRGRG